MPVPSRPIPAHCLFNNPTHLGISLSAFQLLHRKTRHSKRVTRESKGPHMSPQFPPPRIRLLGEGDKKRGRATHLAFLRGTSQGMGLKPPDQGSHTHPSALSSQPPELAGTQPHLAHRHPEDAGVQQAGGRVGAHLTHEGELLPPPHTVLPHLLPAGQTGQVGAGEHKHAGQCQGNLPGAGLASGQGMEKSSHFSLCITK